MRVLWLTSPLVVALAVTAAAEAPRTTLGVLTCTAAKSGEGGGTLACSFKGTESALEERYVGTAQGLPVQVGTKEVLVWTVMGPANARSPAGLLAQRYQRAKVPGHAPVWVGASNPAIALQFASHRAAEIGSAITHIELTVGGTSAGLDEPAARHFTFARTIGAAATKLED